MTIVDGAQLSMNRSERFVANGLFEGRKLAIDAQAFLAHFF